MSMLGFQMDTQSNKSALLSNHDSFLDPSIGEYCLMLATSNSMRNALGERNAAILGRWAILMSATALNKCGLPVRYLNYTVLSIVVNLSFLFQKLSLAEVSTAITFSLRMSSVLFFGHAYYFNLKKKIPLIDFT